MANITEYVRQTSFTDAQAADPVSPLSGPAVDAEFDRVKASLDSTKQSLDLIQRDDGALANGSVGFDQIDPAIYTGLSPVRTWSTGVSFTVNATVFYDDGTDILLYRCIESHVSNASFAVDLAAGRWLFLADYTPPSVSGTVGVANGGTGATTAGGARTNLGLDGVMFGGNNLTDLGSVPAARSNLGLGAVATLGREDVMTYRGVISDATDFDDVLENGYWYIDTNLMTNGPSDNAGFFIASLLQVTNIDLSGTPVVHQVLYTFSGRTYIRFGNPTGPVWSDWQRPIVRTDLTTNADWTADTTKLSDRATTRTFVLAQAKLQPGTSQAMSGKSSEDWTGIPAGVNEIVVAFDGLSLSGANNALLQLGDASSVETTGYVGGGQATGAAVEPTNGFFLGSTAASAFRGFVMLTRLTGNTWVASGNFHSSSGNILSVAGSKTLTGEITRVRLTRSGSDTFDGGTVNVLWR